MAARAACAVERDVGGDAADGKALHYTSLSAAAAAMQPGDHLIIAAGIYRDAIVLPKQAWNSSTPTLIEGRGRVVIDASDIVGNWIASDGLYSHDWPQETAQVSVDGVPLTQVGGTVFGGFPLDPSNSNKNILATSGGIWPGRHDGDATTMPDGSFFYDRSQKRLYIRMSGKDLNDRTVEVSVRAHGLLAQGVESLQIKNLSFLHGNTSPTGRDGLVSISGHNVTLDHVSVDFADSVGIELDGDDNVISNSSANHCGQLGIKGRGARMLLVGSETSYNNTRGFNKWWEAGGVKFVGNGGLSDSVVRDHVAIGNRGDGIWFDWGNPNNKIEHSISEYNTGFGIQYEASSGAHITGNRVIGNGQRGIFLPHSSHSVVSGNLVAGNGMEGIAFVDEGRRDPSGKLDLRPIGDTVLQNVIAWNGSALTVPAAPTDVVSDANLFIGQGVQLRIWSSWSHPFDSFPGWQQQTGLDLHSSQIVRSIDVTFADDVRTQRRDPDLKWLEGLRSASGLSPQALATLSALQIPLASKNQMAEF